MDLNEIKDCKIDLYHEAYQHLLIVSYCVFGIIMHQNFDVLLDIQFYEILFMI